MQDNCGAIGEAVRGLQFKARLNEGYAEAEIEYFTHIHDHRS